MQSRITAKIKLTFKFLFPAVLFFLLLSVFNIYGQNQENAAENEAEAIRLSKIWTKDSIENALVLFEKTALQFEKLGLPRKSVFCLNEAAKLTQINSDYKTAQRVLEKALKLEKKHALQEEKAVSLALSALINQQKNDVSSSKKDYLEALNVSRTLDSPIAKGYANFSAGMYNFYFGNLKDATLFFEQADNFASQTQDIQLIALSLHYVGFSLARDGDAVKGLEFMNLALQKCSESGDLRGQALSYFGIGFLNMLLNEKQKALENFKKSEKLFPSDFEWIERAKLYNNMGVIYEDYGDLESAENFRIQAFDFFVKADYSFGQLGSLPSLAELKFHRGKIDEARQSYKEIISRADLIDDNFHAAIAKEGLGNIELKTGNFKSAIEYYRQAIGTYNQLDIKLPRVDNNLGLAYEKKGETEKAKSYFDKALQANLKTKDLLPATENLYNLARINLRENKLDTAVEQIRNSINITETLYSDVLNTKLKRNYFSNSFDHYNLFIEILMKKYAADFDRKFLMEAIQAAERSRARSMLENLALSEADFIRDADPEDIKKEKEIRRRLNDKADKLTDILSGNADITETERLSKEINALENELENLKAEIKRQSPIYSAIKNPPPLDVADFQQNVLDENSIFLEFSLGENESYLWMIEKEKVDSFILPPRSEIEPHVEKLRELLVSREMKTGESIEDFQKRVTDAETNYRAESKILSNRIFGQIADKIGSKRLIIVPDGKLHYFPVSALPLPNSDSDEPLLLTNETVYAPSAQTLLFLEKSDRQNDETANNLLIFSDPVFTADDARFSTGNKPSEEVEIVKKESFRFVASMNSLQRLTASRNESDSILNIVGTGNADSFTGFDANRENLLKLKTEDYKIIHFATHGKTDENRPELSGIVLSRFNEKGNKLNEFFRIHDIYGLNLKADLVVLSACETGLGKEVKGEGLMSLNNAFLQSGAKSVMASLWKVEDNATLELMKSFYGGITVENLTPSQSLRKAQLKLRQNPQTSSPFYWAAFTIQGDFKNVPKISASTDKFYYFSILIPVILIAGFLSYRKIYAAHFGKRI